MLHDNETGLMGQMETDLTLPCLGRVITKCEAVGHKSHSGKPIEHFMAYMALQLA